MLKVNRAKRVLQINRVSKILLKRTGPKEHLKNYKEDVRIVTLSLSIWTHTLMSCTHVHVCQPFFRWTRIFFSIPKGKISFRKHKENVKKHAEGILINKFFLDQEKYNPPPPLVEQGFPGLLRVTLFFNQNTPLLLFNQMKFITQPKIERWIFQNILLYNQTWHDKIVRKKVNNEIHP